MKKEIHKHWITSTNCGTARAKCGQIFKYNELAHSGKFNRQSLVCDKCESAYDKWVNSR